VDGLLVQREGERRAKRAVIPLRPLEEIVEDSPEPDEPPEVCEECGAAIERPTGTPPCPETALDIAMYEPRFLAEARDDGTDDLFELLDALDARDWEHLDRGEPVTPGAREHWRDERDKLQLCRQTCEWLIQHGAEAVSPARALLLAEASRLAERHGDPHGYLTPAPQPVRRGPGIGRNDPCPCGSGRKFKRCCLDRDREPPQRGRSGEEGS
jgi:SEC-C motif